MNLKYHTSNINSQIKYRYNVNNTMQVKIYFVVKYSKK